MLVSQLSQNAEESARLLNGEMGETLDQHKTMKLPYQAKRVRSGHQWMEDIKHQERMRRKLDLIGRTDHVCSEAPSMLCTRFKYLPALHVQARTKASAFLNLGLKYNPANRLSRISTPFLARVEFTPTLVRDTARNHTPRNPRMALNAYLNSPFPSSFSNPP